MNQILSQSSYLTACIKIAFCIKTTDPIEMPSPNFCFLLTRGNEPKNSKNKTSNNIFPAFLPVLVCLPPSMCLFDCMAVYVRLSICLSDRIAFFIYPITYPLLSAQIFNFICIPPGILLYISASHSAHSATRSHPSLPPLLPHPKVRRTVKIQNPMPSE